MMRLVLNGVFFAMLFCSMPGVALPQNGTVGGDFRLTDQDGKPFSLEQLRGKVVLLFFGYTFCPDVCPTELGRLSAVLNALAERSDEVRGVFVSLDPERDTPAVLKGYTGYFHSSLIGLTGAPPDVARVAAQYQVKYSRHALGNGRYSLDHSANLYVIDQQGRLATIVPFGLPADHVLEVTQRLIDSNGERVGMD